MCVSTMSVGNENGSDSTKLNALTDQMNMRTNLKPAVDANSPFAWSPEWPAE